MATSYLWSPEVTPLRKINFCSESKKPDIPGGMWPCLWRECCRFGTRAPGSRWMPTVPWRLTGLGPYMELWGKVMRSSHREPHERKMLQLWAGTITVGRPRLNPDAAGAGPWWKLRKGEGQGWGEGKELYTGTPGSLSSLGIGLGYSCQLSPPHIDESLPKCICLFTGGTAPGILGMEIPRIRRKRERKQARGNSHL